MKINTFIYFFLDAMKSLKQNFTLTIISVINISATLFIVGLFRVYLLIVNKNFETTFMENKGVIEAFRYIEVAVFVILPPISLLLIVNGIKMVVFSRKNEISIMKSIGATDWFIRWPFIIQGLVVGVIGAFVANLSLFCVYSFIYTKVKEFEMNLNFVQPKFIIDTTLIPFVIGGALIGPIGSIIALRKVINLSYFDCSIQSKTSKLKDSKADISVLKKFIY